MLHGIGVLLVAVIGGYWLLERALTHKGQMKQLGLLLGSLIIIGSLVAIICQLWCAKSGKPSMGWCPYPPKASTTPPASR